MICWGIFMIFAALTVGFLFGHICGGLQQEERGLPIIAGLEKCVRDAQEECKVARAERDAALRKCGNLEMQLDEVRRVLDG